MAPLAATHSNGRVILTLSGDLTKDKFDALKMNIKTAAEAIKAATAGGKGGKTDIILDMSRFSGVYDVEAMEMMANFAKANEEYVAKTAGFGGPDKAVAAGQVTAALANRENIRFFPTLEEAAAWLGQPV